MSTAPPVTAQSWRNALVGVLHPLAVNAVDILYNAIQDHDTAIVNLKQQLDAAVIPSSSSSSSSSSGGGSSSSTTSGVGMVNKQVGALTYSTQVTDNGGLVVVGASSAIAVTLTSTVTLPFVFSTLNTGTSTATYTPGSGTINGQGALPIGPGGAAIIFFDGTNWWCLVFPSTQSAPAHQWFDAYNAFTGLFAASQPAFSDISGTVAAGQLPDPTATDLGGVKAIAPVAHEWVSEIDTSGEPHLSQPDFSDLSGEATAAQLPAGCPIVSFGTGAPSGTSTEGYLYFDTSVSPYAGYVYHGGAWNAFN